MSAQKVLPIMLLAFLLQISIITTINIIIICLGFSSSVNKEDIEVI